MDRSEKILNGATHLECTGTGQVVESEQLIAVNSGVSGRPATTYRIASAP